MNNNPQPEEFDREPYDQVALEDRFLLPQTYRCDGCYVPNKKQTEKGTKPCRVERDVYPATWWMHQAITMQNDLIDLGKVQSQDDKGGLK